MRTKPISILLSVLLIFHISCASSYPISQKQFQIDSQTFNQGEWVVVVYVAQNGDLLVEKRRLKEITKVEVILYGPPSKRIALTQIKRIDKFVDDGLPGERRVSPEITPTKSLILAGLFIVSLGLIGVIFYPDFDFVTEPDTVWKNETIPVDRQIE
jgi:hypothetical protein